MFVVSVNCIKCGGILTAESGQLNSPEVFNNGTSPLTTICNWTIVAENKTIELQVLRLNLKLTTHWCSTVSNVLEVIYRDFTFLTHVCRMDFPTIMNLTSPFPIVGLFGGIYSFYSNLKKNFCEQILDNLARHRVLHCLPICYKKDARLIWVKTNVLFYFYRACHLLYNCARFFVVHCFFPKNHFIDFFGNHQSVKQFGFRSGRRAKSYSPNHSMVQNA